MPRRTSAGPAGSTRRSPRAAGAQPRALAAGGLAGPARVLEADGLVEVGVDGEADRDALTGDHRLQPAGAGDHAPAGDGAEPAEAEAAAGRGERAGWGPRGRGGTDST